MAIDRMAFHVNIESVNDGKHAHMHSLDIPSPLLYGFSGCMNKDMGDHND